MSDAIMIFAGPSLQPSDRRLYSHVEFRPPIADGDIFRMLEKLPRAIGIIDGYFGDRLSIFHKEILWGMAQGIRIYGAASMGALRAAELNTYGMVGIGQIYQRYRTGELMRDDAVAVSHGPEDLDFMPTSISLVDVEATLASLRDRDQISNSQMEALYMAADQIHFTDRTWAAIEQRVHRDVPSIPGVQKIMKAAHVEAKRLDALQLLETICDQSGSAQAPHQSYLPPDTPAFRAMFSRGRQTGRNT